MRSRANELARSIHEAQESDRQKNAGYARLDRMEADIETLKAQVARLTKEK